MTQENAGANSSAAGSTTEQMVPVSVVTTLREELNNWKEFARNQQAIISQNPQNTGGTPTKEEDPVKTFFAGREDDDVVTAGELKELMGKLPSGGASKLSPQDALALAETRMAQEHPDYHETVNKYLPGLIKDDPGIAEDIRNSKNPARAAYRIASMAKKASEQGKAKEPTDAEKAEQAAKDALKAQENLGKPKTGHEMGGTGAGLGKAHEYENMSEDDLELRIAEVKRRGA